jgi:hypothetical protein
MRQKPTNGFAWITRYLREAVLAADGGEVLLPWQLTR